MIPTEDRVPPFIGIGRLEISQHDAKPPAEDKPSSHPADPLHGEKQVDHSPLSMQGSGHFHLVSPPFFLSYWHTSVVPPHLHHPAAVLSRGDLPVLPVQSPRYTSRLHRSWAP